ncbi:MAG: hypothetical protein IKH51_03160 [Clostridia bacterium]|nr:hypothetical protein [Clostridia bacterium]
MLISEKFGQRLSACKRRFAVAEPEFVDNIIECLFEFVGFQIPADIFPCGEKTISVSVEIGSEFTDLTCLSRQLLRLSVEIQSLVAVPRFEFYLHDDLLSFLAIKKPPEFLLQTAE